MSIGSFVLGGVGGGSTVALFINEGFGIVVGGSAAPAVVSVGGIVKRSGKRRFHVTIDGVTFTARSPAALQSKVNAWRRGHLPANDTAKPQPDLYGNWRQPKKAKEVVQDRPLARTADTATAPAIPVALGPAPFPLAAPRNVTFPPPSPLPAGQAAVASQATAAEMAMQAHKEAAQRELHALMAQHAAEDEHDLQALMAILGHAA